MIMTFKDFFHLIYIGGYFKTQDVFLLDLLKGSVDCTEGISFSKSALNRYIQGYSIDTLVEALVQAKYSVKNISDYIKSLYGTCHKDTKTYNARYGNKNYKEALFDIVNKKYDDITEDNMAETLAKCFFNIIDERHTAIMLSKASENCDKDNVISSYIITNDEKTAIRNICGIINTGLNELNDIAHELYVLFSIIHNYNNEDHKWRIRRWRSVNKNQALYNEKHNELQSHCTAILKILKTKGALNTSIKTICDIAEDFCDNKYIFTKDGFDYDALKTVQTKFDDNCKLLLEYLEKA